MLHVVFCHLQRGETLKCGGSSSAGGRGHGAGSLAGPGSVQTTQAVQLQQSTMAGLSPPFRARDHQMGLSLIPTVNPVVRNPHGPGLWESFYEPQRRVERFFPGIIDTGLDLSGSPLPGDMLLISVR